jgi:hypothetical protein
VPSATSRDETRKISSRRRKSSGDEDNVHLDEMVHQRLASIDVHEANVERCVFQIRVSMKEKDQKKKTSNALSGTPACPSLTSVLKRSPCR